MVAGTSEKDNKVTIKQLLFVHKCPNYLYSTKFAEHMFPASHDGGSHSIQEDRSEQNGRLTNSCNSKAPSQTGANNFLLLYFLHCFHVYTLSIGKAETNKPGGN